MLFLFVRAVRRPRIIAAIATLTLAVTACTTSSTDEPTAAPESLVLAVGSEPDGGFDPTLGWGEYGSPLFQSTLLRRDSDLELVNDLATGVSVSDDGLIWTVTIRDDVRFHDGEPLTAHDVAFTFSAAAASGGVIDLTDLAEARVVDEVTVELELERPRSTFIHRLATLGIVPAHAHGDDYGRGPVGSGPFVFERWDTGQQVVATRYADYHGDLPEFARIVLLFTDADTTLAATRSGDVHLASVPQTLAGDAIEGMSLIRVTSVDNRGVMFPYRPDTGEVTDDGKPIGNDVTSDLAIRQAINVAVDRSALVEGVLEGFGTPAYGPVDGLPWFEPASIVADGDLDSAAAILEAAGWTGQPRSRDGVEARFTLLYPGTDPVRQALALAFRDMVAELGIVVDVDGVGWDIIDERRHTDAVVFGWGSHDPTEMYNLHHSALAGTGSFNAGFFADDQVDTYLDLAMGAASLDEANVWWRAAQLDEDGHGFSAPSLAAWAWLINLDHTYYADECLDLGQPQVEPHGHGWPVTAGILDWRWVC
ncbi:MAG: ABC transporter substrate-binding protein [Nitriliruptoraceae bacterium]